MTVAHIKTRHHKTSGRNDEKMVARHRRRARQMPKTAIRVTQPLLSEPCVKRPVCHSDRGAPSVSPRQPAALQDSARCALPVLLMKDHFSRSIQAWVVERTGPRSPCADVVQRALQGLRSFGHRGRVLIKTDNEPAILPLKEEIMRRLEVGAIPFESAHMSRKATALWKMR